MSSFKKCQVLRGKILLQWVQPTQAKLAKSQEGLKADWPAEPQHTYGLAWRHPASSRGVFLSVAVSHCRPAGECRSFQFPNITVRIAHDSALTRVRMRGEIREEWRKGGKNCPRTTFSPALSLSSLLCFPSQFLVYIFGLLGSLLWDSTHHIWTYLKFSFWKIDIIVSICKWSIVNHPTKGVSNVEGASIEREGRIQKMGGQLWSKALSLLPAFLLLLSFLLLLLFLQQVILMSQLWVHILHPQKHF